MNIFVLNATRDGIDIAEILNREREIAGIIGLSERSSIENIAGYTYGKPFCERLDIPFYEVNDYKLNSKADRDVLLKLKIDVLIVTGWQRLIPSWLIQHVGLCSVGIHGSPWGITKGRGRSPQNWSLILDEEHFFLSIFKISPGIDSGEVISERLFRFNILDDIKTSHYKVLLLAADMLRAFLELAEKNCIISVPQKGKAEYLPQRIPEDGAIDWNRTRTEVYNFVRALTRPYPGAFSFLGKTCVKIWRTRPMEIEINDCPVPGEIAMVFASGDFLVGVIDGWLLVEEYEIQPDGVTIEPGNKFSSVRFGDQIKVIVERHKEKYPNLPVSKNLLSYIS